MMNDLHWLLTGEGMVSADPGSIDRTELLRALGDIPEGPGFIDAFCRLTKWIFLANVQDAVLQMIEQVEDALLLAQMVDCLEQIESIPQSFGRTAWRALSHGFESKNNHPWMRAQALRGALVVAQSDPSLVRRLQACLLDVAADDDPTFLRHVAKVTGAVLQRDPHDDFRSLLGRIVEVEGAADEAALELGLDQLRQGLLAGSRGTVVVALQTAHKWFCRSLAQSEQRADASLYEICTRILIDVQGRGLHSDLHLQLPELRHRALEFSAYASHRHPSRSWLATSAKERFHWLSMASKLAVAAHTLTREFWLEAALVIEDELLSIFFGNRKFFGAEDGHGVDLVARDALVDGLKHHRHYLAALDQWLVENASGGEAAGVSQLRKSITLSLENSVHRHPFEASTSGRLVEVLMNAGYDEATATMAGSQIDISIDRNQQVSKIWQTLMLGLGDNENFRGGGNAKALLEFLCTLLLRFLDFRANTGVSTDPAAEYVFRRGSDLPVEHDLQLDFLKFLATNDAPSFKAEARDVGGGRADIAIEFRAVKTIIEVKKDPSVPDNATLARRYAGQTSGYLTTGASFGFLLVLDLTDRGGAQPNIRDQISVERKTPNGSSVEYHIVVARIQGRRKTPHALK